MSVSTGKNKKSNLNQPTTFTILHPWPGLLHKPPPSSLQSFQYFLGASIFLNTASLISKARHKLIPGILQWGDIKTHLEVSVEASLHALFSQVGLTVQHAGASLKEQEVKGLQQLPGRARVGLWGLFSVVGC